MERLVGTSNGTVGGIAAYRTLFQNAYPGVANFDDFNIGHAARAIGAYEGTLVFVNTPLDRYLRSDSNALSEEQKNGAMLFFNRARCAQCHNGPMLSDFKFHVVANPQLGPGKASGDDKGLAHITASSADNYKFRTAPLRNVELSAPFTHAGAFASLERVVRHYSNPRDSLLTNSSRARRTLEWPRSVNLSVFSGQIQDKRRKTGLKLLDTAIIYAAKRKYKAFFHRLIY